jgi:syntaxin 16
MENLNAQKMGSGSQNFDFLTEENKKPSGADFVDRGFTQDQMQLLEDTEMVREILFCKLIRLSDRCFVLQVIDQRNEEIVKIAKSIEELAQIFRELAVLVIDQGTILDRIDYNMENAVEHAKQGVEQLNKAEEHQKNSMSVKCIILLVVLIAIMVGILAWKHSGKK